MDFSIPAMSFCGNMRMRFFPRKSITTGKLGRCRREKSMYEIIRVMPSTYPRELLPRKISIPPYPITHPSEHPQLPRETPRLPTFGGDDVVTPDDILGALLDPEAFPPLPPTKRRKKRNQA